MDVKIIFERGKVEDVRRIYEVYQKAITKLIGDGIDQWDEIYPDLQTIAEDIKAGQLTVGKIEDSFVMAYVLNLECFEGYENGTWRNNHYMVLHRLCIHPDYQNMGMGQRALQHIEMVLKSSGIQSLRLDAFPKNPASLRMYGRQGYEKVGELELRKGLFFLLEKIF